MNRPVLVLLLTVSAVLRLSSPAVAQDWHHVHISATDQEEAAAWYVEYMEGEARGTRAARFGNTSINVYQRDAGFEGSVGSSLDHIGFSFPDLAAKLAEFEKAGIKILSGMREFRGLKIAFIEDPWGTKIEVVQDADRLGFHHVHLYMDEPEADQDWFVDVFGGEPSRFLDAIPAVDYEDMWLFIGANRSDGPLAPTLGRSTDHIGWMVDDLDAAAAAMKAKGATFHEEPHWINDRVKISYIDGPGGVNIEVLMVGNR